MLPFNGYFRFGEFQPAYGWRFDDHTSFVREKMLWPANSTDTGIEFGIYPHGIAANIGIFNGTNGRLDDDKGKAIASRLESLTGRSAGSNELQVLPVDSSHPWEDQPADSLEGPISDAESLCYLIYTSGFY